jgi:hypothetical protein
LTNETIAAIAVSFSEETAAGVRSPRRPFCFAVPHGPNTAPIDILHTCYPGSRDAIDRLIHPLRRATFSMRDMDCFASSRAQLDACDNEDERQRRDRLLTQRARDRVPIDQKRDDLARSRPTSPSNGPLSRFTVAVIDATF